MLKISSKNIKQIRKGGDWDLQFDGKVYKTVRAKDLYDRMTKRAWWYNEPGALFLDTVENMNNAPHHFKVDRANPCVAKGTLVNTPRGYRKVEDIHIGDAISTLHRKGYEHVKSIEVHEDMLVNKAVFSDGNVQYITDAHIYHVKSKDSNKVERKRFDELSVGDKIQIQPVEIWGEIDENSLEYKRAVLVGILLGDGSYSEKSLTANNNIKISTSSDDAEYNENLKTLIREAGFVCGNIYVDKNSKSATLSISNGRGVLEELGIEPLLSYEKYIPEEYLSNKNKLAGVVNGLIASDGNILVRSGTMPLVRFKTSSEKLYHSYRKGLLNLGVKCGLYYGDKERQKSGTIGDREIGRKHDIYEAYTSGAMAKDLIRILPDNIHPDKKDRMDKIMYNYITSGNHYFVELVEIERHVRRDTVYDLYCEGSDTWITEGVVQQGCGEIVMGSYSLCCLSSINFSKLVRNPFTEDAYFDFDRLNYLVKLGVRFLDNVLDATDYPLKKIEDNSKRWRRIGLGFTGLGDTFMKMRMPYGSKESVLLADKIANFMAESAYNYSVDLAIEKGSFPGFDEGIGDYGFIKKLKPETQKRIKEFGLRNIGLLTVAPTGTTSLTLGNNCSSGIEPIFSLQYDRTVRQDDGSLKTDTVYDGGWLEYIEHSGYKEGDGLPDWVITSHQVPIKGGIDVQASFQNWIDHSISRTINIPFGTPLEEYKDIFLYAWEKGLKGITSFHEGAAMEGVLTTKKEEDDVWKTIEVLKNSTKRPDELPCDIFEIQVNKEPVIVLVGLNPEEPYNGLPYEIFYTDNSEGLINLNKAKEGKIVKITDSKTKPSRYDLVVEGKRSKFILEDLAETFNDDYATMCRLLSLSMRHQIPIEFIMVQMNKVRRFGTFQKAIARVLKKYVPDGEMLSGGTASKCPECGESMRFENGCTVCASCGFSTCG